MHLKAHTIIYHHLNVSATQCIQLQRWDLGERAQWESTFSLLPIAAKEKSICFE